MIMIKRDAWRAGLLVVAGATALAACSSSGSSGSSTSSTKTGGGTSLTKSPIRIMNEGGQTPTAAFGGISFPYPATGAQAAAAAINAGGGIDGHKLIVDVCDNKGDPNGSVQCARTAVANKDIALVGTFDPIGAAPVLNVISKAHIPYIGGLPTSPIEYSSPDSFQFDPGPVLTGTAFAKIWKDQGCTRVSVVLPDNAGNEQIGAQAKQKGTSYGMFVKLQLIKPGTPDIAPSLSIALSAKPDCFTYTGDGQTNIKYISGLKKQSYAGKIITSTGSLTTQFLKVLGKSGDGIIVANSTLVTSSPDPMVKKFMSDLSSYLKGDAKKIAFNSNEFAQQGWSSVQLVKIALTGATSFTGETLLKKIPTLCDVNVGNVYPHVNFCKPLSDSKIVPRVYNDQWRYYVAKDGDYVPTGSDWHDLSSTIPS